MRSLESFNERVLHGRVGLQTRLDMTVRKAFFMFRLQSTDTDITPNVVQSNGLLNSLRSLLGKMVSQIAYLVYFFGILKNRYFFSKNDLLHFSWKDLLRHLIESAIVEVKLHVWLESIMVQERLLSFLIQNSSSRRSLIDFPFSHSSLVVRRATCLLNGSSSIVKNTFRCGNRVVYSWIGKSIITMSFLNCNE